MCGVVRNRIKAIGWKISNIKGISPSLIIHKIHIEDGYKVVIERQKRLNPYIKEVVKNETIKLLDAGIIYLIFYNEYVSSAQYIPKKSRMKVVENEKGKLIFKKIVDSSRVCIDYRKLSLATRNDHFPLSFMDQILKKLVGHALCYFLDRCSRYN